MQTRVGLCLFVLTLAGCSASAEYARAKAAVDTFYERMNHGEFSNIVDSASERLIQGSSREAVAAFFEDTSSKLGSCGEPSVTRTNFQVGTGGSFVSMNVSRACSQGSVREEFVWEMTEAEAKLAKYVYFPGPTSN